MRRPTSDLLQQTAVSRALRGGGGGMSAAIRWSMHLSVLLSISTEWRCNRLRRIIGPPVWSIFPNLFSLSQLHPHSQGHKSDLSMFLPSRLALERESECRAPKIGSVNWRRRMGNRLLNKTFRKRNLGAFLLPHVRSIFIHIHNIGNDHLHRKLLFT